MSAIWKSPSGQELNFAAYAHEGTAWNDVGGIYIFAHKKPDGSWHPHYIGETGSFKGRMPSHEQWSPAVRLGATTVLAAPVQDEATRLLFEEQMIQEYQPVLNVQLKKKPVFFGLFPPVPRR